MDGVTAGRTLSVTDVHWAAVPWHGPMTVGGYAPPGPGTTIGSHLRAKEHGMTATRPRFALLASAMALALGGLSLLPGQAQARTPDRAAAAASVGVDIAYEQFTMPNGLRVVVHTDR